uniref:Uncharacterized protein n=1 Tax=Arion vulgaris TaxID=1028688 RepID=A0A0B7B2H4_9EUPU
MYRMFKAGDMGVYLCDQEPENTDHILQTCPTYTVLRNQISPSPTSEETKRYGTVEDTSQITAFI